MTDRSKYPTLSIVVINLNNGSLIEECLASIVQQKYPALELIVIDGGSTDNSVEVIKKFENDITYWVSEPDEGQYHAVQKGFDRSTGEIMAWISSDDKYLTGSFKAVAQIMNTFSEVKWLQGLAREYTPDGSLVGRINLPWSRWSKHRYLTNDFQFIQQESSFWKRELWEKAGGSLDLSFKVAGDMELWSRFFRHEKLYTTAIELAGFRHHSSEQRSKQLLSEYLEECKQVIKREKKQLSGILQVWYLIMILVRFSWGPFFFFNVPIIRRLYELAFAIPPVIHYDFEQFKYTKSEKSVHYPPIMIGKKQVH